MAAETIPFDKALAKELRNETDDLMHNYDGESNCSGRDIYTCRFCGRYTYAGETGGIDHMDYCLGNKLIAELDKRLEDALSSSPPPQTREHEKGMREVAEMVRYYLPADNFARLMEAIEQIARLRAAPPPGGEREAALEDAAKALESLHRFSTDRRLQTTMDMVVKEGAAAIRALAAAPAQPQDEETP